MAKKDSNPQEQPQPYSQSEAVDRAVEQQILRQLRVLNETPERDPFRAAQSLQKIIAATANKREPVSFSKDHRLNNRKKPGSTRIPLKERLSMKTIGIIGLALALTFGGGFTTVQASQDSLPDDVLYPVKLFNEDLKLGLAADPARDQELLLEFTAERIDEITTVLESGGDVSESVLKRLDEQYGMALENAANLSDAELMLALQLMNSQLDDQLQLFQQIQTQTEMKNQEQVEQSLQVLERNRVKVMDALADPVILQERTGEQRPETAPEQPVAVPGEGQGSGDGTGSGEGQGAGESSGAGDATGQGGMGTGNGRGSGGSEGDQMTPYGTAFPGQGGQEGFRKGQ